jgi:hypothetical protein
MPSESFRRGTKERRNLNTGASGLTGGIVRNSFRSFPAEKAVSTPVMIMHRVDGSSLASSIAPQGFKYISFVSAFFRSGRLNLISTNPAFLII